MGLPVERSTSMSSRTLPFAALVVLALSPGTTRADAAAAAGDAALDRPAPLERRWYTPHELLPSLAQRDGLRWAMTESLAGLAVVGGEAVTGRAALDDA